MSEQVAEAPSIKDLASGIAESVTSPKERYARLRVDGVTIAYATQRQKFVVLKLHTEAVAKAPKRFQAMFEPKANERTKVHVTARNLNTARALLEWLGKQVPAAE